MSDQEVLGKFEKIYKETQVNFPEYIIYKNMTSKQLLEERRRWYDSIPEEKYEPNLEDAAYNIKAIEALLRERNIQLNDYIKQLKFEETKQALESKLPKEEYVAKNKLPIKTTTKIDPELESIFSDQKETK